MYDAVRKNDMYAYESITDYITEQILFSDIPELEQVCMCICVLITVLQ